LIRHNDRKHDHPGAITHGARCAELESAQRAQTAGVAKQRLADFERGARRPYDRTIADIRAALERGGVEFTNGDQPGVRLAKD